MKNQEEINETIQNYHYLLDLAERFAKTYNDGNKRKPADVYIDSNGNIIYEKNTACHCHPEYETYRISAKEFNEWLKTHQ